MFRNLAAVFLFACVFGTGTGGLAQQSDTICYNGSILTMVGPEPVYAQAIVVKEGRIAFVGDLDEAIDELA